MVIKIFLVIFVAILVAAAIKYWRQLRDFLMEAMLLIALLILIPIELVLNLLILPIRLVKKIKDREKIKKS